MKKITLLSVFLFLIAWGSFAQCIRTSKYPSATVVSNNSGLPQSVTTGAFSSEYSQLSGLTVGSDYVFTCKQNDLNKYITVTDWTNTVIAHGSSPLTVPAITSTEVRLHYSDNAACAATSAAHSITVMVVLPCSPPLNLALSSATTTSASLTWEPFGEETAWQVLVLPNGTTAPTASTTGTDVTVNPSYTDITLTSASSYQFYVRANCGSEFSPWNGPLNFVTQCDPLTAFSENFDTTATGVLPICWSSVKNGTGSSIYASAAVTNYNFNSASRVVAIQNADSNAAANTLLVSPKVSNLSAGTHRVKFFSRSGGVTGSIQVGTVNNTTGTAVFTAVATIDLTSTHTEYAVNFTEYTGTDNYIAFRINTTALYSTVFVDDVRWEVAPLCPDVSQITVPGLTINTNSAVVNWNPGGSETAWDVVYGATTVTDPTTLTPISPAPTGTATATITGFTDNTSYKVWVRSVCGANQGIWIGPKTFKTACLPTTAINETFDASDAGTLPSCWTSVKNGLGVSATATAQIVNSNFYSPSPSRAVQINNDASVVAVNIMLVSPALSNINAGTQRVKFYAKSSGATGSLQVGTVTSNTVEAVFTNLETISLTSTYTEYIVEFFDTEATNSYIAFRHNTGFTYNSVYIDNVIWEPISTCADVTEIDVPTTTVNSANVTWSPEGIETQWDVVYALSTVTDP